MMQLPLMQKLQQLHVIRSDESSTVVQELGQKADGHIAVLPCESPAHPEL